VKQFGSDQVARCQPRIPFPASAVHCSAPASHAAVPRKIPSALLILVYKNTQVLACNDKAGPFVFWTIF